MSRGNQPVSRGNQSQLVSRGTNDVASGAEKRSETLHPKLGLPETGCPPPGLRGEARQELPEASTKEGCLLHWPPCLGAAWGQGHTLACRGNSGQRQEGQE